MIRGSHGSTLVRGLFAAGLAALVVVGCSRRVDRTARTSGPPARPARDSTVASAMDELPEALRGPAIGTRDSLMRLLAPRLGEWIGFWRAADPALRLDSLRAGPWSAFAVKWDAQPYGIAGITTPAESLPPDQREDEGLRALTVIAPGARYALLIDRYQSVGESENGIEIGGEPDSAPMLIDRRTGRTDTFEFSGTMSGYQWAAWLDSSRFVIGGWGEARADGSSTYGFLEFFDIARGLQRSYFVPAVGEAAYERYRHEWEAWVAKRYRAAYGAARLPS